LATGRYCMKKGDLGSFLERFSLGLSEARI
jgi:hypothetical protein